MTKLTLSADKTIVDRAKKLAKRRRTSISSMVTRYLDAVTREAEIGTGDVKLAPLTLKASGLLKLPAGSSYEELLGDALADKYGVRG